MSEPDDVKKSRFDELVEAIEKSLKDAEASKSAAAEAVSQANEAKSAATTDSAEVKRLHEQATALLEKAKTHQQEILTLLEQSKTHTTKTAEIARIADEKEQRVSEYEGRLEELEKEYESTKAKIDTLIPGATSAGLAKAFNMRKAALAPTLKWSKWIFVASVLGFLGFGLWGLLGADIRTWDEFIVFSLERSPIILGLILLEEFSRRLFNNTLKLEEDYAYKETLSMAFDGYQKAMSTVDAADKETLSHKLSSNVLSVLGERPGRLLEHSEKDDEMPIQQIIAQLEPQGGETKAGLMTRFYEDIKAELKGSAFRVVGVIIVAILIGLAIGRYSDKLLPGVEPDSSKELPTSTSTVQ